jgi:hypothetical protein
LCLYIPTLHPLVPDPSQERERTKLKGSRDKREVTTTIHYFDFVPQDFPRPRFSFGSLSFFVSFCHLIHRKSNTFTTRIIYTVGQSSFDLLGGGGVWKLFPVDIPLLLFIYYRKEREKHKSIFEQKNEIEGIFDGEE